MPTTLVQNLQFYCGKVNYFYYLQNYSYSLISPPIWGPKVISGISRISARPPSLLTLTLAIRRFQTSVSVLGIA